MFRKDNLTSYTIRGKVWKIKITARMKMEKKAMERAKMVLFDHGSCNKF